MLKMDYIFITDYGQVMKRSESKSSSVKLEKSLFRVITDNFNVVSPSVTKTKHFIDSITEGTITYEKDTKKYRFKFSIRNHYEHKCTYLSLEYKRKINDEIIDIYEEFEDKLIKITKDNFIIINSYDQVSEYYCNKIFPSLNNFERLLRLLLFNTYLFQFGKSYTEQMSQETTIKVRETIGKQRKLYQNKGKQDPLTLYFCELELHQIQDILFIPKYTQHEEIKLTRLLEKTDDFSKLKDLEIRTIIEDLKPKSDWDRFFSNIVNIDNIKDNIDKIRKYRNIVAHCKYFRYEQFSELSITLDCTNKAINEAIYATMSKDFNAINEKYLSERMAEIYINMINTISPAIKSFSNNFGNIQNSLNQLFTSLSKMTKPLNPEVEENKNIDNDSDNDENINKSEKE